ncbi:MAG: hypothetical protein WCH46_07305 [bacterium]
MVKFVLRLSLWLFCGVLGLQIFMAFVFPITGHDSITHLNWLSQFPELFRSGALYPRWLPKSFWGFGSPAFYFYPPLAYWCAGLSSYVVGTSPIAIYHLEGFIATLLSIITFYFFMRVYAIEKKSAFIGALIYGIHPYRFVDLSLRNSIGEHWAFVFIPLILLGIEQAIQSRTRQSTLQSVALSSIGWAGVLLSNIPTTAILLYATPIYYFLRHDRTKNYFSVITIIAGGIIGVFTAALSLLPAFSFSPFIKVFSIWNFLQDEGSTGIFIGATKSGTYVALVLIFFFDLWILMRYIRIRRAQHEHNLMRILRVFVIIATVIQLPYLFFFGLKFMPLFQYIQFSYRWNVVAVLACGMLVAISHNAKESKLDSRAMIGTMSFLTLLIAASFYFAPHNQSWKYQESADHLDVPEYLPAASSNNIEWYRVTLPLHTHDPAVVGTNGSEQLTITRDESELIDFETNSLRSPLPVVFHRTHFPTWHLRNRRGGEIPLRCDSLGRITATLPTISDHYQLQIVESTPEKTGNLLSQIGVTIILLCGIGAFISAKK